MAKELLMEAADRTNVLPNSVLLDILATNPDELKKEDFIQFLENKEESLPDYKIDINGKIIQVFNVKYIRGVQAWDIRNIPAGSYIYTLKTKYFDKSDKLIIQ